MARGFNKVVLMGNLARDPDVRYTVERRAWARFTVAVGYAWKNKSGEYQDGTDFISVVAWGPLAERCGRYLKKGSGVLVEGRIRSRSYDARDGSGIDGDRRGSRIHVLRGRGPHEVRSHRFERVHVRLQGSRIGVEVLSGSELGRVDEDRDDDVVGERVGLSHELQVSGVQGTHGHHERLRSGQAGERLCQLVARVGEGGTMRHSSILASSALRCVIESLSSRRAIRAGAGFPRPSLRRGVGTTPC